jgi:tetratricopeptide (TPR) repeat protein
MLGSAEASARQPKILAAEQLSAPPGFDVMQGECPCRDSFAVRGARKLQDSFDMMRSIFAAICMVLFASNLQAAGIADLKAAQAAAEKGTGDEAIQLFTQALAAGDLSADDQYTARKGRGREYSAKSLIADAFNKRDDGRRLRDNAIADFSAALGLKADEASVFIERGQDYHLNEQFDLAIADFSAALKLNNSPSTLVQRAASRRAKGAYDEAIADCTAALASEVREAGLDAWDVYNERGYAEFLAGRYDAAAADFDKALALGASAHTDDVLWLPYQLAWLHIANARAGHNDAQQLKSFSGKFNEKQWPGTLISFFLGEARLEDVSSPSSHGTMGRSRECNLSLFAGEDALSKNNSEQAQKLLLRAREVCSIHTLQYLVAGTELDRMKK